ncbi:hypothetical protein RSO01_76160 [Reyranella soli]|uniref:DNA ligase (ATP) n=1 Tax=Reyranella soli TaxID=1230389 RepID=A0A512NND6_9HYPH|nr:hypothetical protein RSO01_76160 [Reyranella soli]
MLGYYTEDGHLHYAGRAGTGITDRELKRLAGVLALQVKRMPLAEPPLRDSRFGSPLKLSRVHWVRSEMVVEVTYLTWTDDNLLRPVSYQAQREDNCPSGHLKGSRRKREAIPITMSFRSSIVWPLVLCRYTPKDHCVS